MYMYPYVYIYVCEWIIEIGWVHLNAQVMSGEKVDRRNSEREILVGRNVWGFYGGGWICNEPVRTGTLAIKREDWEARPGGMQPMNKCVGWSIGMRCSGCVQCLLSHDPGERGESLGKLDRGDLGGMRMPIWGTESFWDGEWNEKLRFLADQSGRA